MKKNIYNIAIKAAIDAGTKIMKIYESPDFFVENKEDNSPLTKADIEANKIINTALLKTNLPIISEENKQIAFSKRKEWDAFWIVDPLDGTKEFIKRNGEFTVNIALCKEGKPCFGVIYAPVLKTLYVGDVNLKKAHKILVKKEMTKPITFLEDHCILPVKTIKENYKVVGSRSHMNIDTENFIEELKKTYSKINIVAKGSSLKFCLVAEGEANVYPRFAPTMEWDTAAGHAICNAVGLKVTDQKTGKEMEYNKPNLLNNHFLVS